MSEFTKEFGISSQAGLLNDCHVKAVRVSYNQVIMASADDSVPSN